MLSICIIIIILTSSGGEITPEAKNVEYSRGRLPKGSSRLSMGSRRYTVIYRVAIESFKIEAVYSLFIIRNRRSFFQ